MSEIQPRKTVTESEVRPIVAYSSDSDAPRKGGASSGGERSKESRWQIFGSFLLMMAAIQLVMGPKIRLSQWQVEADSNAAVAEGAAWKKGRLDLPPVVNGRLNWDYPEIVDNPSHVKHRLHDSAFLEENGKYYNVFPPMMSILTFMLSPVHERIMPDGRIDIWLQTPFVLLVFWPLPIAGFIVFRRRTGDSLWAAVLTLAWMGGSAVLPNLHECQTGYLGQINHVISQVGLLILAADVLGKQRIWPGLIGILISTYTRQITFLYGLVLLWLAWRGGGFRRFVFCGVGLAVVAAPLLTLNYLKFGNPLDFGYRHIYKGREKGYMGARCLTYGMFSHKFILGVEDAYANNHGNAYYMHIAPPEIDLKNSSLIEVKISDNNQNGTSLWITTPLAFWVLIAAGRWWRDRNCRILMLGTLPVMVGLLCYHSPGFMEHGYNRFALDFLPLWLVVVAPFTRGGWRTWLSLGFAAWSLLYFQTIVPDQPVIRDRISQAVVLSQVSHGKV
ncbi:MAG: hypothetical protein MI923_29540 [Phycisphaerales bacterium]|nr:hypothetical protein [Phycisphaerales bacterium]